MKTLNALAEKILLSAIVYILIAFILVAFVYFISGGFIQAIFYLFIALLITWALRFVIIRKHIGIRGIIARFLLIIVIVFSTDAIFALPYHGQSFSSMTLFDVFYLVYVYVVLAALIFYIVGAILKWKQQARQKTEPPEKPPTSSLSA